MRADMKKVLTESPRAGSHRSYHEVRQREKRGHHGDLDSLPNHKGMRRPYKEWKDFTDHISPLIRYLWSCVGRPWNDVWSDIVAQVPSNNVVDSHLKDQHVRQEVERNCFIIDDEVYALGRFGRTYYKPKHLFVDPRDGLLKSNAPDMSNAYRNIDPTPANRVIHNDVYYLRGGSDILFPDTFRNRWNTEKKLYPIKLLNDKQTAGHIDGIWYVFEHAQVPAPKMIELYFCQKEMTFPQFDHLYCVSVEKGRYHTKKKQMSSRALKRYALRNTR